MKLIKRLFGWTIHREPRLQPSLEAQERLALGKDLEDAKMAGDVALYFLLAEEADISSDDVDKDIFRKGQLQMSEAYRKGYEESGFGEKVDSSLNGVREALPHLRGLVNTVKSAVEPENYFERAQLKRYILTKCGINRVGEFSIDESLDASLLGYVFERAYKKVFGGAGNGRR